MRFIVDENTGPAVARWLRDQGHDVLEQYSSELPGRFVVASEKRVRFASQAGLA